MTGAETFSWTIIDTIAPQDQTDFGMKMGWDWNIKDDNLRSYSSTSERDNFAIFVQLSTLAVISTWGNKCTPQSGWYRSAQLRCTFNATSSMTSRGLTKRATWGGSSSSAVTFPRYLQVQSPPCHVLTSSPQRGALCDNMFAPRWIRI